MPQTSKLRRDSPKAATLAVLGTGEPVCELRLLLRQRKWVLIRKASASALLAAKTNRIQGRTITSQRRFPCCSSQNVFVSHHETSVEVRDNFGLGHASNSGLGSSRGFVASTIQIHGATQLTEGNTGIGGGLVALCARQLRASLS